jgi:hypothetical protein
LTRKDDLFCLSHSVAWLVLCSCSVLHSSSTDLSSGFTVFGLALYLSFFSIGMGPGLATFHRKSCHLYRAKAMSVATILNRAAARSCRQQSLRFERFRLGWFLSLYHMPRSPAFSSSTCRKPRSLEQMSVYLRTSPASSILDAEAKILKRRQNTNDSNSPNVQQTAPPW